MERKPPTHTNHEPTPLLRLLPKKTRGIITVALITLATLGCGSSYYIPANEWAAEGFNGQTTLDHNATRTAVAQERKGRKEATRQAKEIQEAEERSAQADNYVWGTPAPSGKSLVLGATPTSQDPVPTEKGGSGDGAIAVYAIVIALGLFMMKLDLRGLEPPKH